jgi:hypothetical protein
VPYHVSLESTLDKPQLYVVTVIDDFDRTTARALGDWIDVVRLNPEASFALDLSRARHVDPRALRRLLARHAELEARGRLEVDGGRSRGSAVGAARAAATAVVPVVGAMLGGTGITPA